LALSRLPQWRPRTKIYYSRNKFLLLQPFAMDKAIYGDQECQAIVCSRTASLSPQEIELRSLQSGPARFDLVDRNDPVCDIVARKIIKLYTDGVRDPEEIIAITVKQLGP
jgi:hypothetical protein